MCVYSPTQTKKIPIKSQKEEIYFLMFRLDFNDMTKGGDPTLDIDLFNEKGKIGIGEQKLHRTKKQLNDKLWIYTVNGTVAIGSDAIQLSFEFQVTTTVAQEIFVKANIAKGNK